MAGDTALQVTVARRFQGGMAGDTALQVTVARRFQGGGRHGDTRVRLDYPGYLVVLVRVRQPVSLRMVGKSES